MAKTKGDLEKEIKSLKQIIRDLKSEVKVGEELSDELGDFALGVRINSENKYEIIQISFDKEKKCAIIGDIVKETKSTMEAIRISQLALGKHITVLNKGR